MPPSSSAERSSPPSAGRLSQAVVDRLGRWPAFPYSASVRISLWVSVTLVAVLFGWGAWQRRWIADDGLIVLRTVRNLVAGNGPVFNAGERVEANTSTVWTYLMYLGAWVAGPARLEYVALTLALVLSVAGVVMVMLGTARLLAPGLQGKSAVLLPAGALVYIAVPPARDFATSGLENGLVLAYLGLLWWMMVCWSQTRPSQAFEGALAVLAGLSVLVRPELALIGGLALVMMLIAAPDWRRRTLVIVAGGLLPVAYQIFRMGYYGLLFPGTALAKDASGSKWQQGFVYLANFNQPYLLWAPAVLLAGLAIMVLLLRGRAARPGGGAGPDGSGRLARMVQSPPAVVAFIVVSGVLQAVYWIRQGGDFMHGRVLLTPLFCLIAPVSVIPLMLPEPARMARGAGYLYAGATSVLWLAVVGWALWTANSPGMGADATRVTAAGIVDERRFYAQATGHAHPLTAADYLDYPRMRAVLTAIENTPDGALLLPAGNYDVWDVVPAIPPPRDGPRQPGDNWTGPHTVFFTNLGMLGMNVGLDVRVIDQIGLANPLAAHTARIEDGRIGHDKNLFPDWAVAEGPFLKDEKWIPEYLDEDWIRQAEAALACPETEAVLNSVRAPMSPRRFLSNVVHAAEFTRYRIDRVPLYELARCGIPLPEPVNPPYTGLPAAGP
ncbi:MAG: flagellar motor control protein ZomB [Actinomycetota bacterium]|nr:flagellar motor control protein ZomB [Actinomycetota bacterium]